jgi:ketosteroid isomerase-like protein
MHRNRLIPLFLIALATFMPLLAQTTGSAEQQILALEEQSRLAASKNDPGFLKQYATGDYLVIAPDGSIMTKKQALQAIIAGDIQYQSLDFINTPKVRIYGGNTAIVNGEATAVLTNFGQPLSGTFRFTRVWVKQNGGWKIALFHATPEQPSIE